MDKYKIQINVLNILKYIFGMVFIAIGVTLLLRSNLGVSAWDTLNYSLGQIANISIGDANFIISGTLILFVTIKEKDFRYLLIMIPLFIVTRLINLFNDNVLLSESYQIIGYQIIFFVTGVLSLALGGSLMIVSTFPAGIYEEFMLTVMRIFKTQKLAQTRVLIEVSLVILAFILGAIGGFWLGKINLGTLIISLTFGYIMSFFIRLLKSTKKEQN